MKKSELITIIVAGIALLLSGINTYYQFFYNSYQLKVSILDINSSKIKEAFDVNLAFINKGNQSAAISNASLILPMTLQDDDSFLKIPSNEKNENGSNLWPITLKPGEIITQKVTFIYRGNNEVSISGPDISKIRQMDSSEIKVFKDEEVDKAYYAGENMYYILSEKYGKDFFNDAEKAFLQKEDILYILEKYGKNKSEERAMINGQILFTIINSSVGKKEVLCGEIGLLIKDKVITHYRSNPKIINLIDSFGQSSGAF